jgi:hypothetical protein
VSGTISPSPIMVPDTIFPSVAGTKGAAVRVYWFPAIHPTAWYWLNGVFKGYAFRGPITNLAQVVGRIVKLTQVSYHWWTD